MLAAATPRFVHNVVKIPENITVVTRISIPQFGNVICVEWERGSRQKQLAVRRMSYGKLLTLASRDTTKSARSWNQAMGIELRSSATLICSIPFPDVTHKVCFRIGFASATIFLCGPSTSFKKREIDRLRHRPVSFFAWMEMIARISSGQEVERIRRITHSSIEIDDGIKATTGPNPFIDSLPR
jgi:hypothetical protein